MGLVRVEVGSAIDFRGVEREVVLWVERGMRGRRGVGGGVGEVVELVREEEEGGCQEKERREEIGRGERTVPK